MHRLAIYFRTKRGLGHPVCGHLQKGCVGATRALMSITSLTESGLNYISEIWTNPAR